MPSKARLPVVAILVSLLAAPAMAADPRGNTYLSLEGPTGKQALPGTPVLKNISARYGVVSRNGVRLDVMPEFHFVAPRGNATWLRRALVETDSAITAASIRSMRLAIPAGQQQMGATIQGGWSCGKGRYHVTLRAWLEDADGNSGNALQYTIHCNELAIF